MMCSVISDDTKIRVSTVLNRDSKQFGKQYMFDNSEDTCWNSDQGLPQWIDLNFERFLCVDTIHIQFQGGFAGKECTIIVNEKGSKNHLQDIYPENSNSLQYAFSELV